LQIELDRSALLPSSDLDTRSIIIRTAVPTPTLDLISAAFLDKSRDLPETRTLPSRLRHEIGVECSPKHFVGHAAFDVRDDDFHHPSRRPKKRYTIHCRDHDVPTALRRYARISACEAKVL
jgi:hypothetical protein